MLNALPNEVLVRILYYLNDARDVSNCARLSRRLAAIIARDCTQFARPKCNITCTLRHKTIRFCYHNADETQHFHDAAAKLPRFEASSLTVDGASTASSPSNDDDNDEVVVAGLCAILHSSRQYRALTVVLKNLTVQNEKVCDRLLAFAAQSHCRQIVLKNCSLSHGFAPEHLAQMHSVRQYTAVGCSFGNCVQCADRFLGQFNRMLRHELHRPSVPHVICAPRISPRALVDFLNNWLHISDVGFFDIRVEDCPADYVDAFLSECAHQRLAQVRLEFPSRAHSAAHVKAKYNPDIRTFQMFPVIEQSSMSGGFCRTVCHARHFDYF